MVLSERARLLACPVLRTPSEIGRVDSAAWRRAVRLVCALAEQGNRAGVCFAHDARPPELPADLRRIAGAAPGERLELRSADGTSFSAFVSQPPGDATAGVVILPDVPGPYPLYEDLAERFAAAGHPAITLDYFGRTAGLGPRDDDFDFWPHVMETRVEQVQQDAVAARDALRERTGDIPVFTVGFCYGGFQSFMAATS